MASYADSLKPKAGDVAKGLKFPGAAPSDEAAPDEEATESEGESMNEADMGKMLIKAVKLGDAEAVYEAIRNICDK